MLYFIGLGLADQTDITVKGLEAVKRCQKLYLENYTSILQCSLEDLKTVYGKDIILADRELVEQNAESTILEDAKSQDTAFLVIGDPMCATTHIDLYQRARQLNIECEIIHNASIISAVGVTGLQVYKLGKTTSIPFDNPDVETPYRVLEQNQEAGLHTLFLLDLRPEQTRYMTVAQAIDFLLSLEAKKQQKLFTEDTLCVGLARIGAKDQIIKAGAAKDLKAHAFGKPVHSLIVPGKLHFMEEEALEFWK